MTTLGTKLIHMYKQHRKITKSLYCFTGSRNLLPLREWLSWVPAGTAHMRCSLGGTVGWSWGGRPMLHDSHHPDPTTTVTKQATGRKLARPPGPPSHSLGYEIIIPSSAEGIHNVYICIGQIQVLASSMRYRIRFKEFIWSGNDCSWIQFYFPCIRLYITNLVIIDMRWCL